MQGLEAACGGPPLADREGAVTRVFGERMRAGWVGAGEVRRDVGGRLFQNMLGMLLVSGRLGGRMEGCGLGEGRRLF